MKNMLNLDKNMLKREWKLQEFRLLKKERKKKERNNEKKEKPP